MGCIIKMEKEELQEKIDSLFEQHENNKFENHMPPKIAEFLDDVSNENINQDEFKEDVEFARSICEVLD